MKNKNNWFVVEEAKITHYLFAASPIRSITCEMEDLGFPSLLYGGGEYTKDGGNYVFVQKEWQDRARDYLKIIIKNPKLLNKLNKEIFGYGDELFKFGKMLLVKDFTGCSNGELADLYERFEFLHNEAHKRRVPMWIMETSGEVFSKYMVKILAEEIKRQNLDLNPDAVFAVLATPPEKNFAAKEREDFLKLALKLKTGKKTADNSIEANIKSHAEKYRWLPYGLSGPVWNDKYFVSAMKKLLKKSKEEIKNELQEAIKQLTDLKKQQQEISKKYKPGKNIKILLSIAQESILAKAYSKDALFFGYYSAERLFKEIARRLKINLRLLRHLLPWEIRSALMSGEVDKTELEKRWEYSFHYVKRGKSELFFGKEARDFVGKLDMVRGEKVEEGLTEIRGNCARPGYAKGLVKVINKPDEMKKMRPGDILVSHMTDPEIVVAMKKAGAIITDMGGITCHAAIVSRELGIPCVIGTKHATQIFKDGDKVEVDATNGIVKKL